MRRFAQAAKDLQIKQLAGIIMGPEPEDDLDNNDAISNKAVSYTHLTLPTILLV